MTREALRTGRPLQAEMPIGAPSSQRATGELVVFVVLFVVLVGIWACPWVPPAGVP